MCTHCVSVLIGVCVRDGMQAKKQKKTRARLNQQGTQVSEVAVGRDGLVLTMVGAVVAGDCKLSCAELRLPAC